MATSSGWLLRPVAPRARVSTTEDGRREVITLGVRSVRSVDVQRGHPVEIAALSGVLHVTFEGDRDDHLVFPGEVVRFERRGRAVVAALRPSVAQIRVAA